MSSRTASIAVGRSDLYHGGIQPTHVAWLSENSRPAWILEPTAHGADAPPRKDGERPWATEPVRWVPSAPEHILEDGLLLIGLRVLCDPRVTDPAAASLPALLDEPVLDLTELDPAALAELRATVPESDFDYKLAVTVLRGSSIQGQLPILERYPMEVEVCTVSYLRVRGPWSAEMSTAGSLTASWPGDEPYGDRYHGVNLI